MSSNQILCFLVDGFIGGGFGLWISVGLVVHLSFCGCLVFDLRFRVVCDLFGLVMIVFRIMFVLDW